ncbi:DUF805 domain-containing protein [Phreatobacter aquaticus]|uniref:DUF805 domain-containing protein n=1 Tax=Phreatobacter aquaticus TaxID=2570229 RepID=A0A4D7QC04_9HYPH|nr:DUF805 domain-containing protein [Phreatobacter aquaticus]QCK85540.1 DUF805 domain-containing protein [Phreatobacter aquaticus]
MNFQNIDFKKLLLTVDGRIARQDFWIGFAVLFVAGLLNGLIIGSISWILASVVSIAMLFPAYCLSIKRSNDRGHPQMYVQGFFAYNFAVQILTLVGIIGFLGSFIAMLLGLIALGLAIWMLVDLGFLEGTKGPNQYGADPVSTF